MLQKTCPLMQLAYNTGHPYFMSIFRSRKTNIEYNGVPLDLYLRAISPCGITIQEDCLVSNFTRDTRELCPMKEFFKTNSH